MKVSHSLMTPMMSAKTISLTCNNCERMSEIEGEKICFNQGEIRRLTLDANAESIIKMVCNSWSKNA
ncbi:MULTISPECIES: hypothetical protein [unclassified Shewanella]|uniref:hypothetical protein n=1 Tax=unclassified Shewanella TaxID=196818 RepID=UPI001F5362B4|nr:MULTISPECIES: hypothetical protein [unclassified Shewanella]MDO6619739.1 hypothetical protein [Shewanella sp. 6_MG-2023]MDO6638669.1 hypothetical protein [Shewanella sp. 5_MG-2023]MDO6680125.1 hypothetical protein [Shewanella sp. 4_MG-2023]MDO6774511.1 hypothetical protein [Shewanella sp. 3_MG-2023]